MPALSLFWIKLLCAVWMAHCLATKKLAGNQNCSWKKRFWLQPAEKKRLVAQRGMTAKS